MKNLNRIRKQLSPTRRRKIAARAATLIAEEKSLQELRQAQLTAGTSDPRVELRRNDADVAPWC
jgi:hypothetical protein